jgi:hypothetical protein
MCTASKKTVAEQRKHWFVHRPPGNVTAVSTTTHPSPRVGARRRAAAPRRRPAAIAALVLVALAIVAVLDHYREAAAEWMFRLALTVTGGAHAGMTVAGWLTFALVPLGAVVLDRDHRRRFGAPAPRDMSDTMQFVLRERASRGHGVARRPVTWWLRRTPLFAVFAVAAINLPLALGHRSDFGTSWRATAGGQQYLGGWHWSLIAAIVGAALVILAPLAVAFRKRRARVASPTALYVVVALLPLAGLALALT